MHTLPFKVTNCSFSHMPIDNTTERFICQVQRKKMPFKVYMTENEKLRAMFEAGQSKNSIARHLGKSKSVISRFVSRYQPGASSLRMGVVGGPKKITPRKDWYLCIFALNSRFISEPDSRDIHRGATGIRLSISQWFITDFVGWGLQQDVNSKVCICRLQNECVQHSIGRQ